MDSAQRALAYLYNTVILYLSWLLAYLNIPAESFTILAILMGFDIVLGVWRSFAMGVDVNSHKFVSGTIAKLMSLIVILALALMIKGVAMTKCYDLDSQRFLGAILIFILVGESHSIVRNFIAIFYKEDIPEWSAWIHLGRFLSRTTESIFRRK